MRNRIGRDLKVIIVIDNELPGYLLLILGRTLWKIIKNVWKQNWTRQRHSENSYFSDKTYIKKSIREDNHLLIYHYSWNDLTKELAFAPVYACIYNFLLNAVVAAWLANNWQ